MGEIPRSRDAKHPFLRQLITPFYRTRMGAAKRRTATTKENVGKIKKARSDRAYIKQLKKDGTLK
ncbi:hypothetical protein DEJ49_33645 [Streptomyces venezuelae]|uniref:Uncharacterized protein n=1 Tax=Streptomyces venezuelae TaxID=54571 RepID=A0A5P2CQV1_STRVZ|nr:hypothetical protein [Streptomyces venezuelae]QES45284.1 hypothetical protein DEJ49_33645 [Streptomyces venezuelae]